MTEASDTRVISLTLNLGHLVVGLVSLVLAIVVAAVSVASSIRSQIEGDYKANLTRGGNPVNFNAWITDATARG